jgi:hypothetical protein
MTVDESGDVFEVWLVAIRGIDLHLRCRYQDPIEGAAMAREIGQIVIELWIGVRAPHRVVLATLQGPPESHFVADHAVDDSQLTETAEQSQTWPPYRVLERSLSDGRHLISSRQIAGHPTARASRCASVVLPAPTGPLTTTRVGTDAT